MERIMFHVYWRSGTMIGIMITEFTVWLIQHLTLLKVYSVDLWLCGIATEPARHPTREDFNVHYLPNIFSQ